jgi:SAM-dependent methyltransferase
VTLIILPEVEHRAADFELDPEVLPSLWRMEERHFWHAARNRWIVRALSEAGVLPPARILEVGCGSGAVAGALHRSGYAVVGIDTAEVLVRKAHERIPEATFIAGKLEDLAPEHGPFDAIGFFDVLEHLDDPSLLVRQAMRHARPGALVVATVPAIKALYSIVDELAGHKRRYELGELARTFSEAGLTAIAEYGMFRALRPFVGARRSKGPAPTDVASRRRTMLADVRVPPAPLNALLRWACSWEARLGFQGAKDRIGPSLLVTGRVPGPAQ